MKVESFELLVMTEKSAKRFFRRLCRKNNHIFCTRCGNTKAYRIRRGRYRCSQCRYEFGDFTGRWIGELNISCKSWLWIITLFELEVSARKASLQMRISYPTVLKAFQIIRMAITANRADGDLLLQGEIEADETYCGGRRKKKRKSCSWQNTCVRHS